MTEPYTHKKLTDVKDSAPGFGMTETQEARFAKGDLAAEKTGVSHHRLKPRQRPPFGHRHEDAEEVYVVLSGSGRMKLDDEIIDVGEARRDPRLARGHPAPSRPTPTASSYSPSGPSRGRRRSHPGLVGDGLTRPAPRHGVRFHAWTGASSLPAGSSCSPESRASACRRSCPRASARLPIADYGFLSDCETTALVAPSGNVEWLCLPRMDSPSVFGAILDRDAGGFRLGPADIDGARRAPLPARARWCWRRAGARAAAGSSSATCCSSGPWHHEEERSHTHRRAPTDYDADHVLLRTVRCVNGEVQVELDCEPVFDYGRRRAQLGLRRRGLPRGGRHRRRRGDRELRLTTDMRLGFEGPRATAPHADKEGETRVLRAVLERARAAARPTRRPTSGWSGPRTTGSTGSPAAQFPDHPWRTLPAAQRADAQGPDLRADRRDGRRGDDLAARDAGRRAQLGLPLHLDPRLHVRALGPLHARLRLGGQRLLLLRRRRRRAATTTCRSCTASTASASSTSTTLDHLTGYEGARPVRIGNGAYNQRQHDVWGAVLDSVYLHTKSRDRLDERLWPMLERQVEAALEHWREPDRGIWEVRGEPKHFTSSKVMCWVAADRGARLAAAARGPRDARSAGRRAADEIHADICEQRRRRARRVHPALRHRRARRLAAC